MEDKQIVELYFERDEQALLETQNKYENYLKSISIRVLRVKQDAEECVNDAYKKAWDSIPPNRPERLATYLGKIVRNLSISRLIYNNAQKRNKNADLLLSEVEDFLIKDFSSEDSFIVKDALDRFLTNLDLIERVVFVKRYFYAWKVKEIAKEYKLLESNVKVMLHRTRQKLKDFLQREGISV